MKLKLARIFALLLALCILGAMLIACDDSPSTQPTDSGTKTDLSKSNISVNAKYSTNEKNNTVTKIEYEVKVTGDEDAYVYANCAIVVEWTYELMTPSGDYEPRSYSMTVSLDATGKGKGSASQQVEGFTTKDWKHSYSIVSGTVTKK